jgi:hypothetical protein
MLRRILITGVILALASIQPRTTPTHAPAPATPSGACSAGMPALPSRPLATGSTYFSDAMPPERFRNASQAHLVIETPAEISRICIAAGAPALPCGYSYVACTIGSTVHMSNPCDHPDERWAALMCHELAHVQGWPATHGD